jgi:hypothetical protein
MFQRRALATTSPKRQSSQHQKLQQPLRVHQVSAGDSPIRHSGTSDQPPSRSHSLQVDTNTALSIHSSPTTGSPVSSTLADHGSITLVDHSPVTSTRRSSDSSRTMPRLAGPRRERTIQDRSMSMSAATNSMRNGLEQNRSSRPPIPSLHGGRNSPNSLRLPTKKTPIVYPALLSRVAEAFRDRIPIADRLKDGLTYKDAFDGREAVDKIAYIIKTTDRNLALLLGRALDAQKFFHDVTYDHRLRDSSHELYQFRTKLPSPFVSGELPSAEELGSENGKVPRHPVLRRDSSAEVSIFTQTSARLSTDSHDKQGKDDSASPSPAVSVPPHTRPRKDSVTADEITLPSGVFTLLTDCYSPTCSRDQLCYSIACPRRLEQQARLNMKPQPGLSKQISKESLGDVPVSFGSHFRFWRRDNL